ncbi:DUF2628 domain-containing protein [Clostridium sp. SHJSY1]|uniref:DUF2628 domain-containing protein n=1 Tax=Clostridium sp. SHJSY1 TaxID=2942483 RepID=UPI002875827E|nr:DUF2628 domain-containing protein [Clostridium sp. SHJSY1]MDS0526120.1 DUF2628 domain-containing protein [Clostridium sp. SHJSY1]
MFCQKCGKELTENDVCENCNPSHISKNSSKEANESNSTKQKLTFNDIFNETKTNDKNLEKKTQDTFNDINLKKKSKNVLNDNDLKKKSKNILDDDTLRDANKISTEEMMNFIADANVDYYIKKWNKSQKNKNFLSLNFPAFFTNFFWFWYRKMYATAIIIFFASAILTALMVCFSIIIAAPIASDFSPFISENKWLSLLICLIIPLVVSLNANHLYIKHATKKINKLRLKKSKELDKDGFLKILRSNGGTTLAPLLFIITFLIILLVYILIVIEPSILIRGMNYVLNFVRKLF